MHLLTIVVLIVIPGYFSAGIPYNDDDIKKHHSEMSKSMETTALRIIFTAFEKDEKDHDHTNIASYIKTECDREFTGIWLANLGDRFMTGGLKPAANTILWISYANVHVTLFKVDFDKQTTVTPITQTTCPPCPTCATKPWISTSTESTWKCPANANCSPKFENKVYIIPEGYQRKNLSYAKAYCNEISASMVSIHSDQENNFIYNWKESINGKIILLGGERVDGSREVKWFDGTLSNYTNWASGYPIDRGNCFYIYAVVWENYHCSFDAYVPICQKFV
jgi:hypothetical protein